MFSNLVVKSLGSLVETNIIFPRGFTVITGETGSGKSMLINSFKLIAGNKAINSIIRVGQEQAFVAGEFTFDSLPPALANWLEENAIPVEDASLIINRKISKKNLSRVNINGVPANLTVLAKTVNPLLEIHGQNEQLNLKYADYQLALVDNFGGRELLAVRDEYQQLFSTWRKLRQETDLFMADREKAKDEIIRLTAIKKELSALALEPDEDVKLIEIARELSQVDSTRNVLNNAVGTLKDNSVEDTLMLTLKSVKSINGDAGISLANLLEQALDNLEEFTRQAAALTDQPGLPDQDLDSILARQSLIDKTSKKYLRSVNELIGWQASITEELARYEKLLAEPESFVKELQHLTDTLTAKAAELTQLRKNSATRLVAGINAVFPELNLTGYEFSIEFAEVNTSDFLASGRDTVTFGIRLGAEKQSLPISKIASGGELSRIMLAIELVIAEVSPEKTLIFDEIDTGVGGKSALGIGKALVKLAKKHQVIVVSHLPQVAAFADNHLLLTSQVTDNLKTSKVVNLAGEQILSELARMFAGLEKSETAKLHAVELLHVADTFRSSL